MSDVKIPEAEINAMCLTWRHDFGLPYSEHDAFVFGTTGPTPGEKMALQQQMRQIYQHHVLPAILAERERCAKIAENWNYPPENTAHGIAQAIRSSHE